MFSPRFSDTVEKLARHLKGTRLVLLPGDTQHAVLMRIERGRAFILMLYIALAAMLFFWFPLSAQVTRADGKKEGPVDLLTWPAAAQDAAREMRGKYGRPDVESHDMLIWLDKKEWKMISISNGESPHSFPLEHTDVLEQTINYRVPIEKYADLAEFDGSITINRTKGTLSVRCYTEAMNILSLNLAHDIILGKRTVEEARYFYGDVVRKKALGKDHEYMQRLLFTLEKDTSDPDINITGLTKDGELIMSKSAKSDY